MAMQQRVAKKRLLRGVFGVAAHIKCFLSGSLHSETQQNGDNTYSRDISTKMSNGVCWLFCFCFVFVCFFSARTMTCVCVVYIEVQIRKHRVYNH